MLPQEGRRFRGCERLAARAPPLVRLTLTTAAAVFAARARPRAPAWPRRLAGRPQPVARAAPRWLDGISVAGVSARRPVWQQPPAQARGREPRLVSPWRRSRPRRRASHRWCGRRPSTPRSKRAHRQRAAASGSTSSGCKSCRPRAPRAGTSSSTTPIRPPPAPACRPSPSRRPWRRQARGAPPGGRHPTTRSSVATGRRPRRQTALSRLRRWSGGASSIRRRGEAHRKKAAPDRAEYSPRANFKFRRGRLHRPVREPTPRCPR
jgi:hypothetical protein